MRVEVQQARIQDSQADTIVVNLFEGVAHPGGATGAVDQALNGAIRDLIEGGDFRGKADETAVLYPRGAIPARRVIVAGLGQAETFDLQGVRLAAAAAVKQARKLGASHMATIVHGAGVGELPAQAAAQATVEGSLLANYRIKYAPQEDDHPSRLEALTVTERDGQKLGEVETGAREAEAIAQGVALARDLVNLPANIATPTYLAQQAAEIADTHRMRITVGDRAWAADHRMGAFLAVAKGAGEEPRFIVLEHKAGRPEADTIVLVGKGITFDTGGISIKPGERMGDMKSDMGGAAAVLGALKAVGQLELPLNVVAIVPATENMPDANAYRPADIITASNGKTIEIISTDAEGRMVLADGLVYAGRYEPAAVVDLATLTGACVIALGQGVAAGLFSSHDWLRDQLLAAGERSAERLWPLPLWDDYRDKIKSQVADLKNSGGRFGGVGSSAIFLKAFTDYPWAHLDIAGMVLAEGEKGYTPAGATGYGVRLLVEFLRRWRPAS